VSSMNDHPQSEMFYAVLCGLSFLGGTILASFI